MTAGIHRAWAWAAVALAIAAVSLAPFALVDVPAVLDYPNHLARFYLLAHPDDPILSKMYAPHWALLPNVGLDLVGQALLRVLPTYVGGRVLLALSLLAPLIGVVVYARAAFGRWTWWSLGCGVIAFNGIFFLGFMNFLVSLGLALAGAAAWRTLRRRGWNVMAAIAGAAVGLCAFFCHLLGFGFFALLIGSAEAEALWRRRREARLSWRAALGVGLLLAVALGPTSVLYLATHRPLGRGDLLAWRWAAKLVQWLIPFMTYNSVMTVLTAAVVSCLAVILWRKAERAEGASLALAALGVLFLIAPFAAAGGTFVDSRLPLMAALLLFAGFAPQPSPRARTVIAVVFALLIVGRAALVAAAWAGRAQDLADLRAELAYMPPGARLLPAETNFPPGQAAVRGRDLPNFSRMDDELAGVALIERRAFWPLLFADPSQQPVVVRPPFDRLAQSLGWSAPWNELFDQPPTPADLAQLSYLADWRARYDYVLLVGPPPARTPPGLVLVRGADGVSLYRVVR
jgi:hypothetical protein